PKTKMADKENANRPTWSKNNKMMEKNCIPLKPNELTNSTIAIDTYNCEENNQPLTFPLIKDNSQIQHMSLNQTFHLKRNSKEKLMLTEKPKQDINVPKKTVLGFYRGKVVESKINSFRKPLQVKAESSAANKKPSALISNATKPRPMSASSVTVKSDRASNMTTTTKIVSTGSQSRQLVRAPIRNHHDNTQDKVKQGISRTPANVTIRKGPHRKEQTQLKTDLSSVKTSSAQDIKRNEARSRSIASEIVARPASSSNTRPKASVGSRSGQPKETAEQRKARLTEWKAGKGRVLKRPPGSGDTQPEAAGQNEKPAGSFWTTMAEEDEQRLFTEKVNKTFSECLNLINEGCPKEEILVTLNDLIKNIPDAKKLVKYWVCLARLEPVTSPIEHIITIYEKAILAGAQPIEEMRHAIADILTMKINIKKQFRGGACIESRLSGAVEIGLHLTQSLQVVHQCLLGKMIVSRSVQGENIEEASATKEQAQEDIGTDLEPGKPNMENKHHRSMIIHDCEKEHEDKTKDPVNDVKTPDKETRESCLIKYNVSTTAYLQSAKKKIQFDETNSIFKELKFLTPVRRSRRLQDKTSKLPDMLKDHYPCVSSLEQLAELGRETDAFVCRPNAALCPMYTETET
uniref:Cytoskeleton-associated protein 2 C-terminal domain-containing protein n=1 Tax=Loxodonta africana TaxID=9785 RepID=G3UK16_LOXAF